MSLRSFAKRMKCSHQNVSQAIKAGRLERSIGWIRGRLVIVDVALAEQEWVDNCNLLKSPLWRAEMGLE